MSINYTTLFTRIGKIVKQVNLWFIEQANYLGSGTGADAILSEYEARRDLVTGIQTFFTSDTNAVAGWISTLNQTATATLVDLQADLNAPNAQASTVLPLLVKDMIANSQTILKSTVSAPTVTIGGSDVGNGILIVDKQNGYGADDQRIINEDVLLNCITDRFTGATAGAETFSIVGQPTYSVTSYLPQGNGTGPNISVCNESSANRVTNGDFENATATFPQGWTISAGGAAITRNSTTVHSGSGALQFAGNGTITTVTLAQTITVNSSVGGKFAIGLFVRLSGTVNTGSNLQISASGNNGFSTVNLFNADPHGLTSAYALKSGWLNMGNTPPTQIVLTISWTAANTAGGSAVLLMDDAALVPAVVFGYASYALFRGSTDFQRGDNIAVVTANDQAGVFQTYFTRFYGIALPSSASPSISDSLAT